MQKKQQQQKNKTKQNAHCIRNEVSVTSFTPPNTPQIKL